MFQDSLVYLKADQHEMKILMLFASLEKINQRASWEGPQSQGKRAQKKFISTQDFSWRFPKSDMNYLILSLKFLIGHWIVITHSFRQWNFKLNLLTLALVQVNAPVRANKEEKLLFLLFYMLIFIFFNFICLSNLFKQFLRIFNLNIKLVFKWKILIKYFIFSKV